MKDFFAALMEPMAIVGLLGQGCFFSRFLVQWIASEKQGESIVPVIFWYLSLGGGLLVLIYAVWRQEPIFAMGQAVGIFVYTRNLMLIRKKRGEIP
jgi:lipid-A-disaccharide synthase-like uncharacterized protein